MAKFVGIVGTISGKIGTTVFSKGSKGVSYGRSYQPVVANPKTAGQLAQRAKMNLVGQMSGVTPSDVILGLGAGKRYRRAEFNKSLLRVAVVDSSDPSTIVAKIEPEDVVFSKGSVPVTATLSGTPAITISNLTLSLTLSDAAKAGEYGEIVIAAVIDPESKGGYSALISRRIVFENTTAVQVTMPFPRELEDGTMVAVYRVPFIISDDASKRFISETIANNGNEITAAALLSVGSGLSFGGSQFVSKQVFHQA